MKKFRLTRAGTMLALLIYSAALMLVIAYLYAYNSLAQTICTAGFLLLLVCSVFAWFMRTRLSAVARQSVLTGLLLGLLWTVEISINNIFAPPLPGRDIIDNIFWGCIALGILAQSCLCAYQSRRLLAGIESGAWSGFASGTAACATALSMIVFGMFFITHDPLNITEWAARGAESGAPSMAAYFAFETLAGGLMHLVILGVIMGVLLGLIGGLFGKAASWFFRSGKQPA